MLHGQTLTVLEFKSNYTLFRQFAVVGACCFCLGKAKRLISVHKCECIQFEKEMYFKIQQNVVHEG